MSKSAIVEVQQMLYTKLSTYTPLSSRISGVYDYIDESIQFPFVSIGEDTVNVSGTKTWYGEEYTVTLHAWSRYSGKKEVKEIVGLMIECLTQPMSLATCTLILSRIDYMQILDDPDGITKHGVLKIRLKTKNE